MLNRKRVIVELVFVVMILSATPWAKANSVVMSGLEAWYKADAITGVTNGQKVNLWENQVNPSSLNLVQNTVANQPTYLTDAGNGQAAVLFNPANATALINAGYTINGRTAITVFLVSKADSVAGLQVPLGWRANGPGHGTFALTIRDPGTGTQTFTHSITTDGAESIPGSTPADTDWHLRMLSYNSLGNNHGDADAFIDGVAEFTDNADETGPLQQEVGGLTVGNYDAANLVSTGRYPRY